MSNNDLDTQKGHEEFNKELFGSLNSSAHQSNNGFDNSNSFHGSSSGLNKSNSSNALSASTGSSSAGAVEAANEVNTEAVSSIDAVGVSSSGAQGTNSTGQTIGAAVLKYKNIIWSTADTLRGTGVKESDYPRFMAPFFALALVESRVRRLRSQKIAEFVQETGSAFDAKNATHAQWLQENIQTEGYGYHPDIALHGVGLASLVRVKAGNFLNQLDGFLRQFDPETRELLGVDYAPGQPKFLDIKGVAQDLASRPNDPLYTFCAGAGTTSGWADVDLVDFDNSEVTTLEEHIKRMWADISAETAGEQYTPKDIIELACSLGIEARRANTNEDQICDVYDMACGGGNFVFAAEEALRREFPGLSVRVRGQELNDALYALAALEARFRPSAKLAWGNTLTHDHFLGSKFGLIVANPPYGVDWKAFQATIKASNCGRFAPERMPPTSDGQLLFLQHAAYHLDTHGVAAVVHSGSTLFSGDAGGGESNTRRWLMQQEDLVEAIVQLPKNEFFNTGIATYLWILNRSKPKERKGKVLLINAETCFKKLKKNLNMKNCEVDAVNRDKILDCFKRFANTDISKVLDVDELLYNKVALELHRHDENGLAIKKSQSIDVASIKALKLDGITIDLAAIQGQERAVLPTKAEVGVGVVGDLDDSVAGVNEVVEANKAKEAKEFCTKFNELVKNAKTVELATHEATWILNTEERRVSQLNGQGQSKELGFGDINVKAKTGKAKGAETIRFEVSVDPFKESDIETIPYSSKVDNQGKSMNEKLIKEFIAKWVKDPSTIKLSKTGLISDVGCEINFNKIFPKKIEIRKPEEVYADIKAIDAELKTLEEELAALLGGTHE